MFSQDKDPARSERIWGQYYNAPLEDCFPDRKPGLRNLGIKHKFESELAKSLSTSTYEEFEVELAELNKDISL